MDVFLRFVNYLDRFRHQLSVRDKVWVITFPLAAQSKRKRKWQTLTVTKYDETYYLSCDLSGLPQAVWSVAKGLEFDDSWTSSGRYWRDEERQSTWEHLLSSASAWMQVVEQDWVAANRRMEQRFPAASRLGLVPGAIVRQLLPDVFDPARELGITKTRRLLEIFDRGYFLGRDCGFVASLTADKFFQYCKIAYMAAARPDQVIDPSLTGRQMYELYADRRHGGLLDIDPTSAEDFAAWVDRKHPKYRPGEHPWEIKRGGNTTHIDLFVCRPDHQGASGFRVVLHGPSWTRLIETLDMFLALYEAGLPIDIHDASDIRHRIVGSDNIGLIPQDEYLHRANQRFTVEERVFDVMHYRDLGHQKRTLAPFIRWRQLPVLMPLSQ